MVGGKNNNYCGRDIIRLHSCSRRYYDLVYISSSHYYNNRFILCGVMFATGVNEKQLQ